MSQLTEKNISFNWFLKRATPGHWNKNEQLDLLFIPPTIFFSPNVYLLPLAVATLQFVAACRTIPAFDKVATYKQLKTKSPLPHPHQLKRNPPHPRPHAHVLAYTDDAAASRIIPIFGEVHIRPQCGCCGQPRHSHLSFRAPQRIVEEITWSNICFELPKE